MVKKLFKDLYDTLLNQVETSERHKTFKFGNGHKVIATSQSRVPAQIGNNKCLSK